MTHNFLANLSIKTGLKQDFFNLIKYKKLYCLSILNHSGKLAKELCLSLNKTCLMLQAIGKVK